MSSSKSQYDLFGLDLAAAGRYFRDGWADAAAWPLFRWFNPQPPVRVTDAAGRTSVRLGVSATPVNFKGKVGRTAIELPEDLVLRRSLVLPRLAARDLEAAVALDARSASPFPESDLVWGFALRQAAEGDVLHVASVLSSRALIERHLANLQGEGLPFPCEVWAGGEQPVVVRGFGEAKGKGEGDGRRLRWVNRALLVLAVVLAAAIALTPLLQLRERMFDAMARSQALAKASSPQVNLRADLMKFNASLEKVGSVVAVYGNPLLTLDELSSLLPDDVLVNSLEFKGNTVRIAGQAANAARLLDLLSAQPGYSEVKAPTATTRVQGSAKEYFTIEFKVDRAEKAQ